MMELIAAKANLAGTWGMKNLRFNLTGHNTSGRPELNMICCSDAQMKRNNPLSEAPCNDFHLHRLQRRSEQLDSLLVHLGIPRHTYHYDALVQPEESNGKTLLTQSAWNSVVPATSFAGSSARFCYFPMPETVPSASAGYSAARDASSAAANVFGASPFPWKASALRAYPGPKLPTS